MDDGFFRGGFWRRVIAWIVDATLVTAIIQLIGVAAFPLTGGAVQSSEGVYSTVECKPRADPVAGLEIPAGFRVDAVIECKHSFLGAPQARFAKFVQRTRFEGGSQTISVAVALDAEGRYIRALDLSLLSLPLLVCLRILLELRGQRSPGRLLTGVRLISKDNVFVDRRTALVRYGLMSAPFLPGLALLCWVSLLPPFGLWQHFDIAGFFRAIALTLAPVLVAGLWVSIDISRRRDTFYDRVAGAAVIRD